jgi:hypothetical protein
LAAEALDAAALVETLDAESLDVLAADDLLAA